MRTAFFEADDFERWWLAGMSRTDIFPDDQIEQLIENCVYLADAEQREMLQTTDDLRAAIVRWQRDWNYRIDVEG
jgi:hypothetical protein